MKMASIYITKEDIAGKLGINKSQFVCGKVEGSYNEIQFDVIIDSDAETAHAEDVSNHDWHMMMYRQRFEDISTEKKEGKLKVFVFGASNYSAKEQLEKLEGQSKDNVTNSFRNASASRCAFETSYCRVDAGVFSETMRGFKLDEIYADSNLTIKQLEIIKLMRKSSDTPIHYF